MYSFFHRPSPHADLIIKFHKEARHYGEHGKIVVSHRKENLIEQVVSFVFVDLVTPPHLTPTLLKYIWEEAKAQGYMPHNVVQYGRDAEIVNYDKPPECAVTRARDRLTANLTYEINAIAASMKKGTERQNFLATAFGINDQLTPGVSMTLDQLAAISATADELTNGLFTKLIKNEQNN